MYLSFFGIALHFLLFWTLYTNDQGHYRILVPNSMEEKEKTITTNLGEVESFTSYTQWAPDSEEEGMFMIHYYDLPYKTIDDSLASEILLAIIDELKDSYNGVIMYDTDLDLNLNYAKLLRIDYNEGMSIMKAKVLIKEKRVFVLQVLSDKSWSLHESVNKFLDSFEIMD